MDVLRYSRETKDIDQSVMRQFANMGRSMPDSIKEEPELEPGLGIYLSAFLTLDRSRNHSMGPCYINPSEVDIYADRNGFDDEQRENLHHYILKMDEYEVGRVAKEHKKQPKS